MHTFPLYSVLKVGGIDTLCNYIYRPTCRFTCYKWYGLHVGIVILHVIENNVRRCYKFAVQSMKCLVEHGRLCWGNSRYVMPKMPKMAADQWQSVSACGDVMALSMSCFYS